MVFVCGVIDWQYDPQEVEVVLRYTLQVFDVGDDFFFSSQSYTVFCVVVDCQSFPFHASYDLSVKPVSEWDEVVIRRVAGRVGNFRWVLYGGRVFRMAAKS